MDLAKKKQYLLAHVQGISRHHDEDGLVRIAILEEVIKEVELEMDGIHQEIADRIAELKATKHEAE